MSVAPRRWAVGCLSLASILTGCATQEERGIIERANKVNPVTAEMNEVITHVRLEHLTRCKRMVESSTGLFNGSVRLKGPLQPHAGSSCASQIGRGFLKPAAKKYVAYLAPIESTNGSKISRKLAGCIMTLENGQLTVSSDAPEEANRNSPCLQM